MYILTLFDNLIPQSFLYNFKCTYSLDQLSGYYSFLDFFFGYVDIYIDLCN